MKAGLYDSVRLVVDVPSDYRAGVLPAGSEGTIVQTFETPSEAYAVDVRVRDDQLVGGYRFENVMLTPEQFELIARQPQAGCGRAQGHREVDRRWPMTRPGRVVAIEGIVFQCDIDHPVSALLIRPIEELSRRFRRRAGRPGRPGVPLANHAGIRVRIVGPDGRVRRYVVEQQTGTLVQTVENALSWTPWRAFRAREGRGGWDVTVPATAFEGVEPSDVQAAIDALNREPGRPFYREICTAFIERIFGGRHLFDDVEVLDWLVPGPGPHIPEPAAPRFKPNAPLSRRARYLLRADELRAVHAAVDTQVTSAVAHRTKGDEALRRFDDQGRAPARVLFWYLSQLGRALGVRDWCVFRDRV